LKKTPSSTENKGSDKGSSKTSNSTRHEGNVPDRDNMVNYHKANRKSTEHDKGSNPMNYMGGESKSRKGKNFNPEIKLAGKSRQQKKRTGTIREVRNLY